MLKMWNDTKKSVMKGLKSHGVGCSYTNSIEQGKRFECQQWHCYKYQAWATKCQGVSNHTPIGYEVCNVKHPFKQSHKHMEGGMGYKIGKKEGWGGKINKNWQLFMKQNYQRNEMKWHGWTLKIWIKMKF